MFEFNEDLTTAMNTRLSIIKDAFKLRNDYNADIDEWYQFLPICDPNYGYGESEQYLNEWFGFIAEVVLKTEEEYIDGEDYKGKADEEYDVFSGLQYEYIKSYLKDYNCYCYDISNHPSVKEVYEILRLSNVEIEKTHLWKELKNDAFSFYDSPELQGLVYLNGKFYYTVNDIGCIMCYEYGTILEMVESIIYYFDKFLVNYNKSYAFEVAPNKYIRKEYIKGGAA